MRVVCTTADVAREARAALLDCGIWADLITTHRAERGRTVVLEVVQGRSAAQEAQIRAELGAIEGVTIEE